MRGPLRSSVIPALCFLLLVGSALALPGGAVDPELFSSMSYRSIGPDRGGRSTAATGVPGDDQTFYMGTTGGGVWKTTDSGLTWDNISDGFFDVASIGAVDVADSDVNVVYVGTGSACIRGNGSTGRGVYKSMDAGRTWSFSGLPETGSIARLIVHPTNPDVVYVAALGHPFGPNEERGVFRSEDGGATWERVLFVSDTTGAVDLTINPNNPREMYAAFWRFERKPWTFIDASSDGGIYKTTDGGDTWDKLGGGLPQGITGRIGVSVSAADPDVVYALVSAADPDGGVYRSDDAGQSWRRINRERNLRTRHWYYSHIIADPGDPNTVYVLNSGMYRSIDAGRTFQRVGVGHGDVHDLWISPDDSERMIVANDGGSQVSANAGQSWSTLMNQPTSEIYRVIVDGQFPYRVYGAQQDNSTISISSRGGRGGGEFYSVGGCESGHIAVDPRNPDVTYAGCYIGEISRLDRGTGERRSISVYPVLVDGVAPRELAYRFQWNAPISLSPHDPDVLYHTSNYVHRSTDDGMSWETISRDLTTNDPEKQELPGGPLQHDHTSVEVYNTIFVFVESPRTAGELWAGSDDGLVHISRDNGESWANITPADMPVDGTINSIDLSAHQPGKAVVAVYRYRMDDFAPYIFKTEDYGASWVSLADGNNGIPGDHPVRVVREDPDREGLLYAGTEFGMFISFDDGGSWQPFQLNLPVTPVTDMVVHDKDLIVSTQGRAFWILDDLTPLHEMEDTTASEQVHLFEPRDAIRSGGFGGRPAAINYFLADEPNGSVSLEILDEGGEVVRSFSSRGGGRGSRLPAAAGMNRFSWNLQYPSPDLTDDALIYLGYRGGPSAVPGTYTVRLEAGGETVERRLEVLTDPNLPHVSHADLEEQFEMMVAVRDLLTRSHDAIKTIRAVREQAPAVARQAEEAGYGDGLVGIAQALADQLAVIENILVQTKSEAGQDPINFPPMLDNQIGYLYRYVNGAYGKPTQAAYARFDELEDQLVQQETVLNALIESDLQDLNRMLAERGVPGVIIKR